MKTDICEALGIEYPIFAFSHCRDVVSEASKAGGFGVLGAVGFTPEQYARELELLDKEIGDRPYGVDVVIPTKDSANGEGDPVELFKKLKAQVPPEHIEFAREVLRRAGVPELPVGQNHEGDFLVRSTSATARQHIEEALKHPNVKMVANALGPLPADLVEKIHAAGVLVAGLCGDPDQARRHIAQGVDVVVAQGSEGGGHTGRIGSIVLWPQVVEAVAPIPVLAAGGIATGAQIAAAMALGASGAWTGSVWLTTEESDLTDVQKEILIDSRSRDAIISKSITGKTARMIRNDWTEAWESAESPGYLPLPLQDMVSAEATARSRAYPQQARNVTPNPVGQVVGQLNDVRRTRDVVNTLVEGYIDAVEKLGRSLHD